MTNEEKSEGFTFDSLGDIHANIQEESPTPNEPAIEAHGEKTAKAIKSAAGKKDTKGVVFDASIHAVNAEGEPSITSLGKFRKKKGLSTVATKGKAVLTEEQKAAARASGEMCADLMVGSCVTLLGDEWLPQGLEGEAPKVKFDEHARLRAAFGDYFVAKDIKQLSPDLMFGVALTGYMVPRLAGGDETKSRLSKAKNWFAGKWSKWTKPKGKKDATHADTGDNGVRKNDTGETAGSDDIPPEPTRSPRT